MGVSLDTAWLCFLHFFFFIGAGLLGYQYLWSRGWHALKILKLREGSPVNWIGSWIHFFLWVIVWTTWGMIFWLIWQHPHPLAPTVPGGWDEWWVNLWYIIPNVLLSFLYFLAFWKYLSPPAAFIVLGITLLFQILGLILTILVGVKEWWWALLFIIPMPIIMFLMYWVYEIWGCYRSCDQESWKKISSCSHIRPKTQQEIDRELQESEPRTFNSFGRAPTIGTSINENNKEYSALAVDNTVTHVPHEAPKSNNLVNVPFSNVSSNIQNTFSRRQQNKISSAVHYH